MFFADVRAQLQPAPGWDVIKGVCPKTVSGWTEYKKDGAADSLAACEAAAEKAGAEQFTWNHNQKPKQCWAPSGA